MTVEPTRSLFSSLRVRLLRIMRMSRKLVNSNRLCDLASSKDTTLCMRGVCERGV
jgi:hypothetical protein